MLSYSYSYYFLKRNQRTCDYLYENHPDLGIGFWFEASDILVVFELKTEIVGRVVTLKIIVFFRFSTISRIVLDLRLSDSPYFS